MTYGFVNNVNDRSFSVNSPGALVWDRRQEDDRIQQLPMVFDRPKVIDRLEALAEALLDFTQLNDLVDWLEGAR